MLRCYEPTMIARFVFLASTWLFAQCIYGNASLEVNSEEDLYQFFENWTKSENVENFREKQRQYTMQLMNSSVDPCDDFFEFACGNFGSIVPENNTWNKTSGLKIVHYTQKHLQPKLLQEEVDPMEDEAFQKVKVFYQSCVGNSTRNLEELKNFIENFAAWPILQGAEATGVFDWLNVSAHAARYEVFPMFRISFDDAGERNGPLFLNINDDNFNLEEFKKAAANLSIDLAGKDAALKEVEQFVTKVTNLQNEMGLLGELEEVQLRDLLEKVPEINFRRYLQIFRGVKRVSLSEYVNIVEPIYFEDLSYILSQTDSKVVANYVFVRFVETAAKLQAVFNTLPVSEVCRAIVKDSMTPAFLGLFAQRYFDEESYAQIKSMVDDIQAEGRKVINESEWLTPETKVKALNKINVVKKNIGLPDHYRSTVFLRELYKDLKMDRNNFVQNYFNALQVKTMNLELTKQRKLEEFLLDPLVVNAYFTPIEKGILEVPAAIAQPPVFHKYSAKYVNYGGAGAAIGHEFMHGFDNEGILYDEKGDPGIWWDPRISSTYYSRAGCYYNQYGKYKFENINRTVDGGLTLGENVADNEGLKIALNAYKRWLQDNEEISNIMHNGELLTPVQSFYLAFAQLYCNAYTQDELKAQIESDEHSPGFVRVMGTLSNSPDFTEAYKCPVGSNMNPEQKCKYLKR